MNVICVFLACAGCPLSDTELSSVHGLPVFPDRVGRAACQGLSGLQDHTQTCCSPLEQLSGQLSPQVSDLNEDQLINMTLLAFSHLLQASTSAQDLQLSLDDGYVIFTSNNYTLKSVERYSDGNWHYLSAVSRPTR